MSTSEWWREAIFYQVYPRSFADSNGDGMGDLRGVTTRLDYLQSLGIDALWLSPFFPSPQVDAGYDVADYCAVDPLFGTLDDFDELLAAAHQRNIKITIDVVPNHCSDQHVWFQEAIAAGRGSAQRQRFHFAEGRGENGELPPSNWTSAFGGPSWTRVTEPDGSAGQWYYHLFAPEQPDFNWEHPDVLKEFERVFRFWLDRGVDGFRIDVSDALIKDTSFADTDGGYPLIPKDDGSAVHDIYRHLRSVMNEYDGDRMAVVETGATDDIVALFIRPDEMHLAFNFRFLKSPWGAEIFGSAISESIAANAEVKATTTWVIDNHDNLRSATRFALQGELQGHYVPTLVGGGVSADEELGQKRSRALAVLLLALPGATYIYNGQELGLPNVNDLPDDVLQDPIFFRTQGENRGRDGCRIPMPWKGEIAPYGFSSNASTWLPMPDNWSKFTVEAQQHNDSSSLRLYQHLIALRKEHSALRVGRVSVLGWADDVLKVRISDDVETFEVWLNFGNNDSQLPAGKVLMHSIGSDVLGPSEAILFQVN
jgi:alpha-glucosidase